MTIQVRKITDDACSYHPAPPMENSDLFGETKRDAHGKNIEIGVVGILSAKTAAQLLTKRIIGLPLGSPQSLTNYR